MHFDINDEVKVIDGWNKADWQCNFDENAMNDFINDEEIYTIKDFTDLDDGRIYYLSNNFWWYGHCLKHVSESSTYSPHHKVIYKIKAIQRRRKELGYAF